MVFKFAARTLLELGKELISSDQVALYELIKNAVDAGSTRVEIACQIILTRKNHDAALEMLSNGVSPATVIEYVRNNLVAGAPSIPVAKFVKALVGANGRRERLRAVMLTGYRKFNWIEVRDQGHGMTLAELDEVFLTVGTRSRREENIAGGTYLGDKGVGRLSTMRLGDYLRVTTATAADKSWNILRVDWSQFGHDVDTDVEDIPVSLRHGQAKDDAADHGTTIRVTNLTGEWSSVRFSELLQGQIARMIDPFVPGKANQLLKVTYNGERITVPSIPKALLDNAHAVCRARFRFEDDTPVLTGEINYSLKQKRRSIVQQGAEIYSIAQNTFRRRGKRGHAAVAYQMIPRKALEDLGSFEVEVYWYNALTCFQIVEASGAPREVPLAACPAYSGPRR